MLFFHPVFQNLKILTYKVTASAWGMIYKPKIINNSNSCHCYSFCEFLCLIFKLGSKFSIVSCHAEWSHKGGCSQSLLDVETAVKTALCNTAALDSSSYNFVHRFLTYVYFAEINRERNQMVEIVFHRNIVFEIIDMQYIYIPQLRNFLISGCSKSYWRHHN